MIIEFIVANYLSYNEPTVFSMETGERLRKYSDTNVIHNDRIKLLKNAIIFGANGSGKSNLFSALSIMKSMVIRPTDDISDELPYNPFVLNDYSTSQPTKFSLKLLLDGEILEYGFSYTKDSICSESLTIHKKNGKKVEYFERNSGNFKGPKSLKKLFSNTRKNKLFLFDGQDYNDKYCIRIFKWFTDNLILFSRSNSNSKLFLTLKNEKIKQSFLKLVRLADFNIVDVEVREIQEELPQFVIDFLKRNPSERANFEEIAKQKVIKLFTVYKKYNQENELVGYDTISYDMESSGTKKIINLVLVMLNNYNNNVTFILDEFDDSFHLSLAKALIQIINSVFNRNQFIFTSHNVNLLDTNLRVDQIYFTEKSFDGSTELYSLFDFDDVKGTSHKRSDIGFAKRYLTGLFGAMPNIDIEGMFNLLGELDGPEK